MAAPIGYTFENYTVASGEWGIALTADDIRYTYLAGIDLTMGNAARQEITDAQLRFFINSSMEEWERALDIVLRKRIYRCNYTGAEARSPFFKNATDTKWTHIADPYPFLQRHWDNEGFTKLVVQPIISIERAILKIPTGAKLLDLANWVRLDKAAGIIHCFPKQGTIMYGPFLGAAGIIINRMHGDYFDAFEFDFTAGYESSDFIPDELRDMIGMLATLKALSSFGTGFFPGVGSSSISLDGLSESTSLTQQGNGLFGARIENMIQQISEFKRTNRYKYSGVPLLSA